MKKFLYGMAVCLVLASFSSCKKTSKVQGNIPGSSENDIQTITDSNFEDSSDDKIIMHIGHAQTDESPRHRSLLLFKEQVEKQTEGKIKIEIYSNGVIGDETEMTVAVSEGRLEAVRGGDLEFVPKSMLLGLPMIADTLSDARKLCYSDFVKNMLSAAEANNMIVLAVGDDSGFRQITNSVRPILKPADLKGLKIRAPQITATVNFINELGAYASVVPFTELYSALAVGKVSGQENPLALIDSSKFYEVQSYCTIINYQFFPELMYVNLNWWNSLPKKFQEILSFCAKKMMDENARITDEENNAYIKHIQEKGCQITTLTAAQREEFLPYAERVWKKYVDQGYATRQELIDMLAIVGKTIKW
ncbi:TRAP transporter substrate-binding protein [Treponema sp.]|uniref:TRAP transporter substrate-binding protein n=1 Tax=Treponema sp. TaxID=166 RepID=UPI00388E3C80